MVQACVSDNMIVFTFGPEFLLGFVYENILRKYLE